MKAIVIPSPGGHDKLVMTEMPDPAPGPGQIAIAVAYAGLNWADTQIRAGTYSHPVQYPIVPGYEVAGTVAAVGSGVTSPKIGDRVCAFVYGGGYAETCIARAAAAIPLPAAIGFDVAAAFPIQGLTAYHMLFTVYRLKKADVVLVHAIGGGVGLFCTQLAVHAGARVIGTVGTPGKERLPLAYGAERVVIAGSEDFVQVALDLTGGQGVDLALDSLGGETLDRTFAAMKKLGHVISIGEAEGSPYKNIRERLMTRSLTFTRLNVGDIEPGSPAWRAGIEMVLGGIVDGWLKAPIEGVYPFGQSAEMHRRIESRQVSGKLLLRVRG